MTGLPPGWVEVPLAEALSSAAVFGDGDWVETKDQDPDGDVRLTQLADIGVATWRDRSSRFMTSVRAREMGCTFLQPNDVLVARMPEPLGRACLFPGDPRPCVCAVDVCIIRPHPLVLSAKWLMWALNAPQVRMQVAAMQSGTTRKRISRKNLGAVSLRVPPRSEQDRIVSAIEEQVSRLDDADRLLRSANQRARVLRAAVLDDVTRFDGDCVALGDIADIVGGVTKDSKRQGDPSYVEVPYLRVANVQRGYLDLREITTIRVAPEKAKALCLEPGDILFNEGGDRDKLGRGWIWNGEIDDCIHQNHVFRARLLSTDFDAKFVSIHGNTFGRRWFEKMGKQTTNLASINLKTLKSFPVPMLPLEEQHERVEAAERHITVLDSLMTAIDHARLRSDHLRRAVLAEAFAGRLVPQDPDDEPASQVLARVAAERTDAPKPRRRQRA